MATSGAGRVGSPDQYAHASTASQRSKDLCHNLGGITQPKVDDNRGQALAQCALMVSGRGGFEIIQKALVAGIPLVASVSAPSGLAVPLARELGLTPVGFLRGRRFLIYSGEQRLA